MIITSVWIRKLPCGFWHRYCWEPQEQITAAVSQSQFWEFCCSDLCSSWGSLVDFFFFFYRQRCQELLTALLGLVRGVCVSANTCRHIPRDVSTLCKWEEAAVVAVLDFNRRDLHSGNLQLLEGTDCWELQQLSWTAVLGTAWCALYRDWGGVAAKHLKNILLLSSSGIPSLFLIVLLWE